MKTFKTALLGLSMLAGISGAAMAADVDVPADTYADMGWYLRGDIGWSWLDFEDDDTNSLALGGGVGYQYSDYLRADLRVDWAGMEGDENLTTVLGNMYFDIPMDTVITPYLGAGAGYGWSSDGDGFAFALMAGAEVSLTDNLSLDAGYRYRQVIAGDDPSDHQALIGLRFKF
jgi:opacity protein-like surface antigen